MTCNVRHDITATSSCPPFPAPTVHNYRSCRRSPSRPNDVPPRLVLNQVGVPGRPEIPVKDFGEALGVQPSLVLPFDPKPYGQAANNGQMLAEVAPKSKAAEG